MRIWTCLVERADGLIDGARRQVCDVRDRRLARLVLDAMRLLRRRNIPRPGQLEGLTTYERERLLALSAIMAFPGMAWKRAGIVPARKVDAEFKAVLARNAALDLEAMGKRPEPEDFPARLHLIRDSITVVGGSQFAALSPTHDLFYRVILGRGLVLSTMYQMKTGSLPAEIDPTDTVPPPHLREFLDRAGNRLADHLTASPSGTWKGDLRSTLEAVAGRAGEDPLLRACTGEPLSHRLSAGTPRLGRDDLIEMTGDHTLARTLAG